MDGVLISEILIKNGKKICSSQDIAKISKTNYIKIISKLLNTRWIRRLEGFKGIYYVLDPEERERRFLKLDSFAILTSALNIYLGDQWYFGRITALSLSGLINQPVSTYYVINKNYSKEINSVIFGRVVFVKTSASINPSCGIITNTHQEIKYRICDLERNMADYIYSYLHGHTSRGQISNLYRNYKISKERLTKILLKCYPKRSAIKMLSFAKAVSK